MNRMDGETNDELFAEQAEWFTLGWRASEARSAMIIWPMALIITCLLIALILLLPQPW